MQTTIRWNSRLSFIFAASAAAIGLGNIWRFPYMLGQHGGGLFVILYLICIVVLGVPLLIAETALGKLGRRNPVAAIATLAVQSRANKAWGFVGSLNILASFLILTYYVVIVGWVINYVLRACFGEFHGITEPASIALFAHLQSNSREMFFSDTAVMLAAIGVVIFGVKKGLERAILVMFPVLFALLILLLVHAMLTGHFVQAVKFLFYPDFHELTARTILLALGQAFFSLNVAVGVTILFSAYLPEGSSVISSAVWVALADTVFALLAGLIIFPVVFKYGLQPGSGPSLIFKTLPLAFGQMKFGYWVALLFFVMLFFAAFSSVIAMLEPTVSWLMEQRGLGRKRSVVIAGAGVWLLSLATIGSFSHPHWFSLNGVSYFQGVDFLTASILLPVGGMLLALFCGWRLSKDLLADKLKWQVNGAAFLCWQFILRYIAPIAVVLILLMSLGLL